MLSFSLYILKNLKIFYFFLYWLFYFLLFFSEDNFIYVYFLLFSNLLNFSNQMLGQQLVFTGCSIVKFLILFPFTNTISEATNSHCAALLWLRERLLITMYSSPYRKTEDFLRIINYVKHVSLPKYLAYLRPKSITW